ADVDNSGVFAGPHHDVGAFGGKRLQVDLRRLVGAVLGPHRRVHRELRPVRLPPERIDDLLVLVRCKRQGERELETRHQPASSSREGYGLEVCSTRRLTASQMNDSPSLRTRAPGSNPASHTTWKPLQIPRTNPPSFAKRTTEPITGENRAMAPHRR